MKAVVHDRYGPPEVLRIEERERPVPKDNEVLVRVRASTVNLTDAAFRNGKLPGTKIPFIRVFTGLRTPKQQILGREFAGEIEAVGAAVTEFKIGDRVFGFRPGANAEYMCVREAGLIAHIPEGTSFEEAAAVPDGFIQALLHLRRGGVGQGTRLLVYGATGSCGTAAVQLARHLGAHVTAVGNTKNVELVHSLGADEVIDYEREDFTKNGETYEVILDAVGLHSFLRSRRSLKPSGLFVATDGLRNVALWPLTRFTDKKIVMAYPRYDKQDILLLKQLIQAGEYRAVIDRTYQLGDVVDAHRYVETRQKTGNVVLSVDGGVG